MDFKNIDEVCEYLNNYDGEDKVKITINGNETFDDLDVYFGNDRVVLAYVDEGNGNNIDFIMSFNDFGKSICEVWSFDRNIISDCLKEYAEYIKDGGMLGVSRWLMEEYGSSQLSICYDVLEEIEKKHWD